MGINKTKTVLLGLSALFIIMVVSFFTFVNNPSEQQYIYYCSATEQEALDRQVVFESEGWTCDPIEQCGAVGSCTHEKPSVAAECLSIADEFSCLQLECDWITGEGLYSLNCQEDACVDECTLGDSVCNGKHQVSCVKTGACTEWADLGLVIGECNIECLDNPDCGDEGICFDNICQVNEPQDPCENVICDSDFCADSNYRTNGRCTETGVCIYDETECGDGLICNDGVGCEVAPECQEDIDCGTGNECLVNKCYSIPGYCDSDNECADDEYCSLTDNQCKENQSNSLFILIISGFVMAGLVLGLFIWLAFGRRR